NGRELWDSHRTLDSGLGEGAVRDFEIPCRRYILEGLCPHVAELPQAGLWLFVEDPSRLDASVDRDTAGRHEELALQAERIGQRQTAGSFQATSRHWENLWGRRLGVHQGRRVFHKPSKFDP